MAHLQPLQLLVKFPIIYKICLSSKMAEAAVLDQLWTWQWIKKGANVGPEFSQMWGLRLEQTRKTGIADERETPHTKRSVEFKWGKHKENRQ